MIMSQYANVCSNIINQFLLADQRSGNRAKMASASNTLSNQGIFNEMVSVASMGAEMEASRGIMINEQSLIDIVKRVMTMYLCVFVSQNPSLIYEIPGMSVELANQNLLMLNQVKNEIQQFLARQNQGGVFNQFQQPSTNVSYGGFNNGFNNGFAGNSGFAGGFNQPNANTASGMFSNNAVSIVNNEQTITQSRRGPVYRGNAQPAITENKQEPVKERSPTVDQTDVLLLEGFKMNRNAHYVKINNIPYPIELVTESKVEDIPSRFVIDSHPSTLLDIGLESAFNSSYVKLNESGKKALITSHFVATPVLLTEEGEELLETISSKSRLTDVIVSMRLFKESITSVKQMQDLLFLDSYILRNINDELSQAVGVEGLYLDSVLEDYLSLNDYLTNKTATQVKAFTQYDKSKMSMFLDVSELNESLKETFIDFQSDDTEYNFLTRAVKIATVNISEETFFYTNENKRISFEETPWLSDIAEELFKDATEAYLAVGNFKYRITKSYIASNYYIQMV